MANELPHENVPSSSSDESGQEEKFYETKQTQWIDQGYVAPRQEVHCEGLAILDGENYNGFKDLDVNMARLHFQHELPSSYIITERIGRGAFGCCFLVKKQKTDHHVVLKVIHGIFQPRRPVLFYKTCSLYTIMISFRAKPLVLNNLKFIVGMLKFLHTVHSEVHADLNPGNMMYFIKNVTRKNSHLRSEFWGKEAERRVSLEQFQKYVIHDFIDNWFSMEDEHIAGIIDADIGGKIGEAKFVVNHQHHDPRNATWQVSDDVIGLMNWIVLKSGHKIKSHATRGIEYAISLESLKHLHAHIIDMYTNLDRHFINGFSVKAPEEPFTLELKPGECYLDELLVGKFLHFESFKGSYSLSSSTNTVTSCIRLEALEVIQAEPVKLGGLRDAFSTVASGSNGYHTTLTTVLDLLRGPEVHGGAIFVIVDKEHKNDLKISTLDNDYLNQFCRLNTERVNNKLFQHLLHAFCTPSKSDRWEQSLLDNLATQCGMSSELAALEMQPKDGAFVLSHSGTVLAAAAKLEFLPQHYQLCKANGMRFGTRHSAALATAEWMRFKNAKGIVFVRSDAGDVHVMFPHGKNWKSEPQEYPWLGKEGQKLPLILCIEDCKKEQSKGS
ncbi:hypothetical protein pdam_00011303 [Pocillopora damicornis]|uniref:Uncharacterized protein n=1 Tax=Pocillopora damicornis TaxID=46731 RepID=A0A3M6TRK2_POCDA|nr:hypothetical protein pdam_00011303 [Pocillopora damicornis]